MRLASLKDALPALAHTIWQHRSFKNAKISVRLGMLVGFLSLMMIVGGILSLKMLAETENELNELFTHRMTPMSSVLNIQKNTLQVRTLLLQSIVQTQQGEDASETLHAIENIIDDINVQWEQANLDDSEETIKNLLDTYKAMRYSFGSQGVFPIMNAIRNGDAEEAVLIEAVSQEPYIILEKTIGDIVKHQLALANKDIEISLEKNRIYTMIAIAGIITGLILAIVFSIIIIRGVTRPLNRAVKLANHVANGDLTYNIQVNNNDEIGQLLQALSIMNERLKTIVSDVYKEVDVLSESSKNIANSSNELADRIEHEAITLDLTTSHMSDVVKTNRNSAESASEAHKLSESARKEAEDGVSIIEQAVLAMNTINNSSGKISEITSTIDSIAFQTNLLALNASVEAARAGDQGLGFAVVASEVRNLSQRTATAAKEIKALIDNSVEQIKSGKSLVDQSGQALEKIQENIHDVADIVHKINIESVKQTAGIDIINRSIDEMHTASTQNSSTVVMSAVASDNMAERVNALVSLMKFFKLKKDNDKITDNQKTSGNNIRTISVAQSNKISSKNTTVKNLGHRT